MWTTELTYDPKILTTNGHSVNSLDMATFGTTSPLTFLINPLTPINLPLHGNQTPNPTQPLTPGDQLCLVPNVASSGILGPLNP